MAYSGIFQLILVFALSSATEAQVMYQSGPDQTHLIELYSTQSCSSCPPAQEWVSNLKKDKSLWKSFIPIVFHVDYWDYLGWKDPYSEKKYSRRQRKYVSEWKSRTAYTPMFVLNGQESRTNLIQPGIKNSPGKPGLLKVKQTTKKIFQVEYFPKGQSQGPLTLNFAIVGLGISTKVTAGENSGNTLKHDFLTLWSQQKLMKKSQKNYISKISIDVSKIKIAPEYGLVFWVTSNQNLTPIQATGGPVKRSQL